jgi:predicted adenylyl cyclase CyaB
MPVNLELKAKITNPKKVLRTLKELGTPSEKLIQTDTYFLVKDGRLKLREFGGGKSELIYYVRNEGKGRRWSKYDILPVSDSRETKGFLKKVFGVDVVVKKSRLVYFYKKQARIHLDRIPGLGPFIEFEVYSKENKRRPILLYRELESMFGIEKKDIIRSSYADLIRTKLTSIQRK